jgi:lipopolysaccharide transport system permease protein
VAWAALTPLAQLAVYTFVFRSVLGTRWQPGGEEGTGQFAITLFAGLVVFQAFAEAVGRAPGLIAAQPNLVRKVVFPVEILPVTAVAAAFVQAAVGLALVALLATLAGRPPGWNALWLPLVLAPCAAFVLGIAWFLAAVGTFLRDLGHVVPLATQLLIFLTPVFYPLSAAGRWAGWLELNPLAVFVENVRRVWLWDRPPTPSLGAAAGVAFAALWLGYAVFRRARPVFADVV